MQFAEFSTIAKSLPQLRWNTHKSLILSYSADFSVIVKEKYHESVVLGHELVEMSLPKQADSAR